jgi:uncharacterized protein
MKPELAPLVVNVADLLRHPGARRHLELHGHVPLTLVGTSVSADDEVGVSVTLEVVSEGILATGTVVAPWRAECRRCLRGVVGEVEAEFQELFERHPTEGETYPLRHEEVDLEPLAREVLLLELPLTALCRGDCPGICPTCGADLSEGPCGCDQAVRDPRWAALDDLRLE